MLVRDFTRRVGVPSLLDQTPATLRPPVRMTLGAKLLVGAGRPLWAYRVELVGLLLLAAAAAVLRRWLGEVAGAVTLAGLGLVVWVVPGLRAWVAGWLRCSWVTRRWTLAVRHAELANFNDRVPRVVGHEPVVFGDRLRIRVPPGLTVSEVQAKAEMIAAFLRVREVRVSREPPDASLARVAVVARDILATTDEWPWPLVDAARLSLWAPVPVGISEDGEPVSVELPYRNVLIGGEPDAGKSVGQSLLACAAALDPTVELFLFDGTYVDLAPWSGCAKAFIGPNLDEAKATVRGLLAEMDQRNVELIANRRRKVHQADALPLRVVLVDGAAFYLSDRELAELFRDLCQVRWAFRCSTRDASDTILGAGRATAGFSADTFDAVYPGVSFLLARDNRPVRLRTFYLPEEALYAVAGRAERLRRAFVPPLPESVETGTPVPTTEPERP
jgi:FtsK/SpoIIIE family